MVSSFTELFTEFSGNIFATFAQILKYDFTVEFNEFISTLHGMDEMNFRKLNFFQVWTSPFGVVDIWWVKPPKGTHSDMLSISSMIGLQ